MRDSTKRLLIIFGSFALLIGTIYMFFSNVMTSYSEIQTLRAERNSRQALLENQREAEEKVGDLFTQYSGLAKEQSVLSRMLPIGTNTPSLMNQIQGTARSNSMRISSLAFQYLSIQQSGREVVRGIGTIRINMSMNGSYERFKSFVSDLETNVRIIDVSSMRIEGGGTRDSDLRYNLVVDAYYQES